MRALIEFAECQETDVVKVNKRKITGSSPRYDKYRCLIDNN